MNLKRKIGISALITEITLVIIGEAFIIIQNDLTVRKTTGAYLTIFAAICIFASVLYSIKRNINKK